MTDRIASLLLPSGVTSDNPDFLIRQDLVDRLVAAAPVALPALVDLFQLHGRGAFLPDWGPGAPAVQLDQAVAVLFNLGVVARVDDGRLKIVSRDILSGAEWREDDLPPLPGDTLAWIAAGMPEPVSGPDDPMACPAMRAWVEAGAHDPEGERWALEGAAA